MKLFEALRLDKASLSNNIWGVAEQICLAFVGAGGKTSALFCLARELVKDEGYQTVIVTTSTHFSLEQVNFGDAHIILNALDLSQDQLINFPKGVVVISGPECNDGRVEGIEGNVLEQLNLFAHSRKIPLLVEADGSRQKSLKAPAEHEPKIPPWIQQVVVVAGLSSLGKELSEKWVHRSEFFSKITNLKIGEEISSQALLQELIHPEGGLKNIPSDSSKKVLLNQATSPTKEAMANRITSDLLELYSGCVLASLPYPDVCYPSSVKSTYECVAGIVLAAGGAVRFGQPKQLMKWRDKSLVKQVTQTALNAGLSPVIVVTGAYSREVQLELKELPVILIENPNWEMGMSTSVIAGTNMIPSETGATIFLLADQPQVPETLIRSLVEIHSKTLSPLVAPQVSGQRGNPVLFDRKTFADLLKLLGDSGGRVLFSKYPVTWLPWVDSELLLDVDTWEDYEQLGRMEK